MRLICTKCKKSIKAGCECGAPYVPAGKVAAAAVAKPENVKKSDRVIATEAGISSNTVRRARKRTAPNGAVERRVGKDGKARRMPKLKPQPVTMLTPRQRRNRWKTKWERKLYNQLPPEEKWLESLTALCSHAVHMEAQWTRYFGDWRKFPIEPCYYNMIKQAAAAWQTLLSQIDPVLRPPSGTTLQGGNEHDRPTDRSHASPSA